MTPEDRERLREDAHLGLDTFLARAARFASEGPAVPRMKPHADLAEARRFIARLRRREVPPLPPMTHDETAAFLERCVEQEEIIRETARNMDMGRTLHEEIMEREQRARVEADTELFHRLKENAKRTGGDEELVREMNRARRAAGGRSRGRK